MWQRVEERLVLFFFFQAEDGIRDYKVTGVQTCALPIFPRARLRRSCRPKWLKQGWLYKEPMRRHVAIPACVCLAALAFCSKPANAQISKVMDDSGRRFFINAEPARATKLGGQSTLPGQSAMAGKSRATIYLPAESSLTGAGRPALSISRDGVEKLVREAAERHRVDPALVRAVIETESNWNAGAVSRKGALGLMQLIPTTAVRFGVNDAVNPQPNVEAGVRYLKTLLERYNGNLDLALA